MSNFFKNQNLIELGQKTCVMCIQILEVISNENLVFLKFMSWNRSGHTDFLHVNGGQYTGTGYIKTKSVNMLPSIDTIKWKFILNKKKIKNGPGNSKFGNFCELLRFLETLVTFCINLLNFAPKKKILGIFMKYKFKLKATKKLLFAKCL